MAISDVTITAPHITHWYDTSNSASKPDLKRTKHDAVFLHAKIISYINTKFDAMQKSFYLKIE